MLYTEMLDLLAIVLFLGGWLVLIARDICERKGSTDPLAALLFMLGSIVLCALQFSKNKIIFIILGFAVAVISILNWFYIPHRVAKVGKEIARAEKRVLRKKK